MLQINETEQYQTKPMEKSRLFLKKKRKENAPKKTKQGDLLYPPKSQLLRKNKNKL